MGTLVQDIRFAARTLRARWPVTLVAVVSLGLAIGGNTAVFSMVDAFLFRPLPLDRPERLVLFGERDEDAPAGGGPFATSLPTWADLRDRTRSLESWAALRPRTVSLRGDDRSEAVPAMAVTGGYFEVVGARPTRGRVFLEEETVEGGPRVVLVSEELREERWGDGDPLGETLILDAEPHTVVGVVPADIDIFQGGTGLWIPLTDNPYTAPRDRQDIVAMARMAPGATMDVVRGEVTSVARRLESEHPALQAGRTLDSYNLRDDVPTRQSRILFGLLQGVVGVVLLIACVNIANLLLARGIERSREIALRTVLGAGRWRIVRQLLTESLAIGLAGGLLGLAVGWVGIEGIWRSFGSLLPPAFRPALDTPVLAFTVAVSLGAGLLFGLAPALQAFRRDHASALREGHGRSGGGRSRKTVSRGLVVAEIALSMVALGVGSMLVRSFLDIRAADPGFDGRDVLVATLSVPASTYPDDDDRNRLAERILASVGSLEGVRAAALAQTLPQGFLPPSDTVRIAGQDDGSGRDAWRAMRVSVSPGYLDALDIPLLRGRFFEAGDRADGAPVAAVNQALASARFPGGDVLGARLVVGGVEREIVGVVADVQQQLGARPGSTEETIYLPQAQAPALTTLLLESEGDPAALGGPVREAIRAIDVDVTLPTVLTMDAYVTRSFAGVRVFNVILGGFGLMALFLAALGTYGVLAYSVSQRSHEIGVRMALGAAPRSVVGLVSRQGLWMGALGLALGILATLPMIGVLRSVVASFSTVDPGTIPGVAAVLAAVTVLASLLPARRAARLHPVETLRGE